MAGPKTVTHTRRQGAVENLAEMVRNKRGSASLRAVAKEIGSAAPTLSRIERGGTPDLYTFIKICRWLKADPAHLIDIPLHTMPENEDLAEELDEAEAKAWDSLSRYKFQMFGYWAAIWVHLNRIGCFRRSNPWSQLVRCARNTEARRCEQD